jgi:hypothetical protein
LIIITIDIDDAHYSYFRLRHYYAIILLFAFIIFRHYAIIADILSYAISMPLLHCHFRHFLFAAAAPPPFSIAE